MATEIVEQDMHTAPALEAFRGYDQSVYTSWVAALGDLMLSRGKPGNMAEETLSSIGGLIYALTLAGEEVDERERKERRAVA